MIRDQHFGRTTEEWRTLVADTAAFLEDQARLGQLTSYSEVNSAITRSSGLPGFDFSLDRDRAAMGAVLGEIAQERFDDVQALLSAIVLYHDRNEAGTGFYRLAQHLELLSATATPDEKLRFWSDQVKQVHARYARPRRERTRDA